VLYAGRNARGMPLKLIPKSEASEMNPVQRLWQELGTLPRNPAPPEALPKRESVFCLRRCSMLFVSCVFDKYLVFVSQEVIFKVKVFIPIHKHFECSFVCAVVKDAFVAEGLSPDIKEVAEFECFCCGLVIFEVDDAVWCVGVRWRVNLS